MSKLAQSIQEAPSLQDLYNLIMEVKQDISSMRDEFNYSIGSLKEDIAGIQLKVENVHDRVENCETRLAKVEDDTDLRYNDISRQVEILNNQTSHIMELVRPMRASLAQLQDRMQATGLDTDDFEISKTMVVTSLPYQDGESANDAAQRLLDSGLGLSDVRAVKSLQLQGRRGQPVLTKVLLESKECLIKALRSKKQLENDPTYSNTYIRGSRSHTERIARANLYTLSEFIPSLKDKYRIAANGKLVPIQGDQTLRSRVFRPTNQVETH